MKRKSNIKIIVTLLLVSAAVLSDPPERIDVNYKYHCEQMLIIKQCRTFQEVSRYLREYGYSDTEVKKIWEIYQKSYMDKLAIMEEG